MKTNNKNIGLIKYVTQLTTSVGKAESSFPIDSEPLTPLDKKHSVKPRKGAENVVRAIAELVKAHGLDSSALDSAEMLDDLETATTLAPLVASLEKISKRVSDAQYSATSTAWAKALQFYALLQRRAQSDGQLAASLESISAFFSYRHESVLEKKATKLQTRANAKLRDAERLVARAKPRASVLEAEHNATATPAPAPVPAPVVVQPAPTPAPAPSVSIIQPAPAPASNGVTNGVATNGYTNGAAVTQ
ncbi:MAG TPA: hypothetical protein VGH28_23975 [Polyangiaceae bacterium]|jgi:hypothetical protein